jgi:ribosome-associated translation inhibitor RaiA
MHLPLQITLRNLAQSDDVDQLIRERADRLQHFHSHLVSCRVVLELAGHQHQGKLFVVRIGLKVRGAEIVVDHQHDEDVRIAIREAFDAARRQLEDQARLQRGDVKFHRA